MQPDAAPLVRVCRYRPCPLEKMPCSEEDFQQLPLDFARGRVAVECAGAVPRGKSRPPGPVPRGLHGGCWPRRLLLTRHSYPLPERTIEKGPTAAHLPIALAAAFASRRTRVHGSAPALERRPRSVVKAAPVCVKILNITHENLPPHSHEFRPTCDCASRRASHRPSSRHGIWMDISNGLALGHMGAAGTCSACRRGLADECWQRRADKLRL